LYAMEFGATPAMVGLFMASTYASISGGSLIAARLAVYLGRKRLFIATGLLSLPAVFLLGQATALWQIVVLTNVLWFAGGVGQAMTAAFTGLSAASDKRGKSFSLLHLASPLGAVLGGTLVSQLVGWKGYPLLFVVLGLVWSIWPLVGWLVEDRPVAVKVVKSGKETAVSFNHSFYLLLLLTLLAAITINVSRLGTSLSMQSLNFSTSAVASTVAVGGLVTMPVTFLIGTLSDRLGRRRFLTMSYLLAAAGALTLILASQLWHFWLAATFVLIARSVSSSVGAALATDLLAPEELGRGLAWLSTAGWITGVVAFAGAGYAIETLGATALYIMMAALALVAALQLRRIRYQAAVAVPGQPVVAYRPALPAKGFRLRLAGLWRLLPLMIMGLLITGCLPIVSGYQPTVTVTANAPLVTAVASPTLAATATSTPTAVPAATTTSEPSPATTTPTATAQAEQSERITFSPGSSSITVNGIMPGQSQKVYLLWAAGGQTANISLSSPDTSILFHLHGQADGVVYKHLLDGEMTWQGVLPVSQDYVLTLDALGEGSRSYTLDVHIFTDSAPDHGGGPLHPVVDGATGYLIGGWHNNGWVDAANYAPLISDSERPYLFYNLNGEAGAMVGQPPLYQGICLQPHVALEAPIPGTVGLVGRWHATPRLPAILDRGNATYREVVRGVLQDAGLPDADVSLDQVLRIDLEGDGIDEVLIVASRLTVGIGLPPVAAGDYAVVLLRKVVGDKVITRPLYLDVYLEAVELAFPWHYEVLALADLNGNGRLEIIIAADRYEGRQVTVFEVQGSGAQAVLQAGCTQ
jgi:MFS family permease